ncbi:MAG: AprI/Inh family metalloprotease inhibitor [Phenylobacterium sp.]|jgi:hypothetical protein|uniref:AprI/Inh family metalloprotease inhibitor n=1 Tax=Phenylobacterium sp. TaxID=1871053 RepID=UPI002A360FF1|nr:AprI/Inh family metalloprotease inhibitor [Phenylobacterium sp.]MDX9996898.1 AprI/Inh family metalloprotease inhibitor [Phenylobacterium sp.]
MRFRALVAAAFALGACGSQPAGARSPALVPAERLAGGWTLSLEGRADCRLRLTAAVSSHGFRAEIAPGCALAVAQWRTVPDGMELAAADGLTLALLAPAGEGAWEGFDAQRRAARLTRR